MNDAIQILEEILGESRLYDGVLIYISEYHWKALEMAIDASDAEMEAIKRKKHVLAGALNMIQGNVRNFPTVEPESHWIPCSERLPDVGAILLSDGNEIVIGEYYGDNTWKVDGCDYDPILEEIAWMPLPEPYQPEEESE